MTPAYRPIDIADVYLATCAPQLERYQTWNAALEEWRPVKAPDGAPVTLTAERMLEMLARKTPFGFYWTGMPSHVVGADFDADEGWRQLVQVQHVLVDAGVPAYGEPSRRGGHLWCVLTERLPAVVLLHGLRAAVQLAGLDAGDPKIEYRPASDRVSEWGHAMRAPQTINHRTGLVAPLRDYRGRVLHQKIAGMLLELEIGPAARFAELAENYIPPVVEAHVRPASTYTGASPIDQFNSTVGVSAVLSREWGVQNAAPGRSVRCPAHDDKSPSLSISRDDNRVWCHSPACDLHGPGGAGHDAYSLWQLARGRAA